MLGVGLNASALMGQAFNQGMNEGGAAPAAAAEKQEDPFAVLEKLQTLHEKGILSKEEFESKKAEVLKRIS